MITIRLAQPNDIPHVKRMADANRRELGFVMRPALEDAQARGELLVAESPDGAITGFVNYRTLSTGRVGWHTIYEICVSGDYRGNRIGRALLDAVPRPLRLKCPVDLAANDFYKACYLLNVWTEYPEGENKRPLNIWQSQPDLLFCAGGNRKEAEVARAAGMLYGVRGDYTAYWRPYFIDVPFEKFWRLKNGKIGEYPDWRVWTNTLAKIAQHRPTMAMIPDYMHPQYQQAMIAMARQLVEAGVERVMICPKFEGAVQHIPEWCCVAVSVPSSYAGYLPKPEELAGRRVHLLGGTPAAQLDLFRKYLGANITVSSLDGNSFLGASQKGTYFEAGKWRNKGAHSTTSENAFAATLTNLLANWRTHGYAAQLPLF